MTSFLYFIRLQEGLRTLGVLDALRREPEQVAKKYLLAEEQCTETINGDYLKAMWAAQPEKEAERLTLEMFFQFLGSLGEYLATYLFHK